jgi:hypothetical protein
LFRSEELIPVTAATSSCPLISNNCDFKSCNIAIALSKAEVKIGVKALNDKSTLFAFSLIN